MSLQTYMTISSVEKRVCLFFGQ